MHGPRNKILIKNFSTIIWPFMSFATMHVHRFTAIFRTNVLSPSSRFMELRPVRRWLRSLFIRNSVHPTTEAVRSPKIRYSLAKLHAIVSYKTAIISLRNMYSESEQTYQYYASSNKTLQNIRKKNNYRLINRGLKSKVPFRKCVNTAAYCSQSSVIKQVSTEQPTKCTW
jgi:hypothetical protein